MPVDLYVGGAEHAVLHLLYARFWHKVLFDRGYVSTPEPFRRLVHQGMILGEIEFTGYRIAGSANGAEAGATGTAGTAGAPGTTGTTGTPGAPGTPGGELLSSSDVEESPQGGFRRKGGGSAVESFKVSSDQVEKSGDVFVLKDQPAIRVDSRAHKMSKARGNVVNPDAIVKEYGADALRLYEMFMGPLEAVKPWSMSGVSGVRNFLDRVWRMMIDDRSEQCVLHAAVQDVEPTREQNQVLHRTIFAVTRGTDRLEFNTSIARMMEFVNFFTKEPVRPRSVMERFTLLLAPYAPHIAEELWEALGHSGTLAYARWPDCDEAYLKDDTVEIPVQILGKLRGKIVVPADATAETLEAAARAEPRVAELLAGKQIVKTVVVPGRMVNFVIR
jgi:leucyl-tRNA synthetase